MTGVVLSPHAHDDATGRLTLCGRGPARARRAPGADRRPELPDQPGNEPGMSETPAPDPLEVVIGWENGVWYDDPIPIEDSDGVNGPVATWKSG